MKAFDFLAVGDITVDSFIRLKDASVSCDISHEHCKICMSFGDKLPYESLEDMAGAGNAPNAAVAAARLGLSSAIVTDIGADEGGAACQTAMQREHVDTRFITTHKQNLTNHHFVLWYEDERTILVKHESYAYHFPDIPAPKWMYLSSIGANSENYHEEIFTYLSAHSEVKLAFQPGTFQIAAGIEKMRKFYERAEVIAVNTDEARRITGKTLPPAELLDEMRRLGSRIALITDGINGSYLHDGSSKWHLPVFPDKKPPRSRTGAGDATSSTFVSEIILGKEPIEALKCGNVNAASVVQEIGAQKGLMTPDAIEAALKDAPSVFKAEKLS